MRAALIIILLFIGIDVNACEINYESPLPDHYNSLICNESAFGGENTIYGFCFPVQSDTEETKGYNKVLYVNGYKYLCTLKAYNGRSLVFKSMKEYQEELKWKPKK